MTVGDAKYKDDLPISTINRIRGILGGLGLLPIETSWKNSVNGFHSVSLIIPNTNLTTNGKGTSYEYALASAYGEMMERLQNQTTFRLGFDVSQEALQYMGFCYAPDEVPMSIEDALNCQEDWLSKQLAQIATPEERHRLLALWQAVSYEEIPADFIALPYLNLRNQQVSHIPVKMAAKMYMSNGMCAGNTREEALVQGISEILERHANKQVIRNKMVPPAIPRTYIAEFPWLYTMLSDLEASGNFNVIVKDCSLGQGFPVVAVICINKNNQSYFVKFGAHPIFEIALERTLTELLQGQDVRNMMGVKEFCYCQDDSNVANNMMSILVTGSGTYPREFFGGGYTHQVQGFLEPGATSNEELLHFLMKSLVSKGYDVFVRDVSYLGFPSFHIIIPGISEIEKIDNIATITDYSDYNKVKRFIRGGLGSAQKNAAELLQLLRRLPVDNNLSVLDLLQLPISHVGLPWYLANIDLFRMVLYIRIGDLVNAYGSFVRFLGGLTPTNLGEQVYYRCVRDYVGTQIDGLRKEEACAILNEFYPQEMVQGVIVEFGTWENSDRSWVLSCWHCKQCPIAGHCLYPSTEAVYKLLKEQNAKSFLNGGERRRTCHEL